MIVPHGRFAAAIDYFRGGEKSNQLPMLIELDLVCTNEIVLSELIPILRHRNQKEIIESLRALKCLPYTTYWEGLRALQLLNLQNGINKVGLPDFMIAQHCIDENIELWSFDKHFRLMAGVTSLKLTDS